MTGDYRIIRLYQEAVMEARKSTCMFRHGALVVRGNHIYASGHNTSARCRFLNENDICVHAEMAAATMFINCFVRRRNDKYKKKQNTRKKNTPHQYDLSEFTVWSVRDSALDGHTPHAAPCLMCLDRLKKWGFGKIAFTTSDGMIQICSLQKMNTTHMSSAHRKLLADNSPDARELRRLIRFPSHVMI